MACCILQAQSPHLPNLDIIRLYKCSTPKTIPPTHPLSRNVLYDIMHHTREDVLFPWPCVIQRVQVERPHAGQQIHLGCLDEKSASELGDAFPKEVETDDDRSGEVFLEECLGTTRWVSADRLLVTISNVQDGQKKAGDRNLRIQRRKRLQLGQ